MIGCAEDFLADEEDLGDEGGGGNPNKPVDYAALGSVEAPRLPVSSGNEASSASSGSLPSVLLDDEASSEEDDVISQPAGSRAVKLKAQKSQAPADSESEAASELDLGSDEGDLSDGEGGGSEDINPFDLASGSESEVGAPEDGYADEGLPEGRPEGSCVLAICVLACQGAHGLASKEQSCRRSLDQLPQWLWPHLVLASLHTKGSCLSVCVQFSEQLLWKQCLGPLVHVHVRMVAAQGPLLTPQFCIMGSSLIARGRPQSYGDSRPEACMPGHASQPMPDHAWSGRCHGR